MKKFLFFYIILVLLVDALVQAYAAERFERRLTASEISGIFVSPESPLIHLRGMIHRQCEGNPVPVLEPNPSRPSTIELVVKTEGLPGCAPENQNFQGRMFDLIVDVRSLLCDCTDIGPGQYTLMGFGQVLTIVDTNIQASAFPFSSVSLEGTVIRNPNDQYVLMDSENNYVKLKIADIDMSPYVGKAVTVSGHYGYTSIPFDPTASRQNPVRYKEVLVTGIATR